MRKTKTILNMIEMMMMMTGENNGVRRYGLFRVGRKGMSSNLHPIHYGYAHPTKQFSSSVTSWIVVRHRWLCYSVLYCLLQGVPRATICSGRNPINGVRLVI